MKVSYFIGIWPFYFSLSLCLAIEWELNYSNEFLNYKLSCIINQTCMQLGYLSKFLFPSINVSVCSGY